MSSNRIARRLMLSVVCASTWFLCQNVARGQLPGPRTYSDYYSRQVQQRTAPTANPSRYTYDRMFYRSPAVSPYTNLMRADSAVSAPNYFRYVRPEQQRRQQIELQMSDPRARGGLGSLPAMGSRPAGPPGGLPGAYQNHWYGSRQSMGLGPR